MLREMRQLHAAGKLEGAQKLFFRPEKPVEELFDSTNDPHEVHDLAGDARYAGELKRLRLVHERFMKETGDLALMPEEKLLERMRPGGKWATTATPTITVAGGQVTARCSTPGASLAYTRDGSRWLLYTKAVPAGGKLRFKACRIGYLDSAEITPE